MDEAGFERAGQRRVRRVAPIDYPRRGQAKPPTAQHLTVVACIGTEDAPVPPLIIFKGDSPNIQESWTAAHNPYGPSMVACVTKSGWINSFIALKWLQHFDKATKGRADEGRLPRLLYLDGHSTHVAIEFLEAAWDANITIFILPANLSAVLQPLDVDFFNPLKAAYHKKLDAFMLGNGANPVPKGAIWPWLQYAWMQTTSQRQIRGAWCKAGLWPISKCILCPQTAFRGNTPPLQLAAAQPTTPITPCSLRILRHNRSAVRQGRFDAMETLSKTEKMLEILLSRDALNSKRLEALEAAQELNQALHNKRKRQTFPLGGFLDPTHRNSQDHQANKKAATKGRKGKERAVQRELAVVASSEAGTDTSEDPLTLW